MILAAAQTAPVRYNIEKNLSDHYRFIEIAAGNGANLIAFPEMSITGYERKGAREMCFTPGDPRLESLAELAVKHRMIIIAGAPLKIDDKLYIGSLIFRPDHTTDIYTKQYLHTGEELYFDSSLAYGPLISLNDECIAPAICYDIEVPQHVQAAKNSGCTIYLSSIYYTPNGMEQAHRLLGQYARQHHINVLMTNYTGQPWETPAGGKSAFWDKTGSLVTALDGQSPELLIVKKEQNGWSGTAIPM